MHRLGRLNGWFKLFRLFCRTFFWIFDPAAFPWLDHAFTFFGPAALGNHAFGFF
jgi:hypothetical protein